MITIDEVEQMLSDIADEIPEDFYRELNGGIVLSPDVKFHPESNNCAPLHIMGEYHNDRKGFGGMGRYIVIYYGSFARVYSFISPEQQKERLRKILYHEFTHHVESLAGEKGLEIKDAIELAQYRDKTR